MVFRNLLTKSFGAALSSLVAVGLVGCGTPMDFQRETFTTESATKLEPVADQGAEQNPVSPIVDTPAPGLDPSLPELPIPMEPGDDEDEMVPEVADIPVDRPVDLPQDAQAIVFLKRVYVVGLRTLPEPQPLDDVAVWDPARKADEQAQLDDNGYPAWRRPVVVRIDLRANEPVDISNLIKGKEQILPVIQSGYENVGRGIANNPNYAALLRNLNVIALVYRVDRSRGFIRSGIAANTARPLHFRSKYLPFYRGHFSAEDNANFALDLAKPGHAFARVKWNQPPAIYAGRLHPRWIFPLWSPRQSVLLGISQ